MESRADLDSLDEHREFVRGVVRRLLRDEQGVEDVLQDTWMAALESPPRDRGALRGWLARVGRNFAISRLRGDARRARRERAAARAEALPAESASRLEQHRMVVEAVLSLREPLRSTILLRFYEDLPPREIARIQGVPVATVRSRVRRGVERLRTWFDRRHESREDWCLALLPLLGVRPVPIAGGGTTQIHVTKGLAMNVKAKLVFLLIVLGVGGTAYLLGRADSGDRTGEREGTRKDAPPLEREEPPAPEEAKAPEVHPDQPEEPAEPEPEPREEPAPERPPAAGGVNGVVKVEGGVPADARVRLRRIEPKPAEGEPPLPPAVADAAGRFRFDGLEPGRYELVAEHPDAFPRRFAFDLPEGGSAGPFDIVLKPGGAIRVRVRGAGAAPLVEHRVRVRGMDARPVHLDAKTDRDGIALFEHLAPGRYAVESGESAMQTATVVPRETVDVAFDLACALLGTVLDESGDVIPGAYVRLLTVEFGDGGYRHVEARTKDDGRFEMRGVAPGKYRITVQVTGKRSFVASAGRVTLAAGQVRDEVVRIRPDVIFGRIVCPAKGLLQAQAFLVELKDGRVARRLGQKATAYAKKDGSFELVGLEPGHYWIWFPSPDPSYADAERIVDFSAGGRKELNVALKPQELGTLRLTVLEPDGSPATGLSFGLRTGENSSRSLHARQIGDGKFEIRLAVGEREVSVWRKGFHAERVAVVIERDGTVERKVRLRPAENR